MHLRSKVSDWNLTISTNRIEENMIRCNTDFVVLSAFILLVGFVARIDAGYSLSPMITILEPSDNKNSGVVVLKHEGDVKAPAAIELKIMKREIDERGKVEYVEDKSANNFVVYPSQVILFPGDIQRVQVQWVGDAIPRSEIAYGLIAEQAPIKLDDENKERKTAQGMVTVLTRYEAIIVVRPAGIKANIVVKSAVSSTDSAGSPRMLLTLANTGTGMQKLAGMKLKVSPLNKNGQMTAAKSITYIPELTNLQTKHSIFAGYSRTIDIPWPSAVPVGPVRAVATFDDGN
jgi:fimbrial chaperone protein